MQHVSYRHHRLKTSPWSMLCMDSRYPQILRNPTDFRNLTASDSIPRRKYQQTMAATMVSGWCERISFIHSRVVGWIKAHDYHEVERRNPKSTSIGGLKTQVSLSSVVSTILKYQLAPNCANAEASATLPESHCLVNSK